MTRSRKPRRQRGIIEVLPSGSLRVKVYAGIDAISKKRIDLTEIVPPGPNQKREAEEARIRLINQVNERRAPRTRATMNQLLDRWDDIHDIDPSTRKGYRSKIRKHIRPLLGHVEVGKVDIFVLETFYAELRRCRDHCDRSRHIRHRTERTHVCDEHGEQPCRPTNPSECKKCRRMCKPHKCRPLSDSTIRQIHWILSGALDAAVRWQWIATNPADHAKKPGLPEADPQPPSPAEAAQLVEQAARRDPDWGAFVWITMTTGARRGEMCALRWNRINFETRVVEIKRSIGEDASGQLVEKDTKTHQQRRVVVDPETMEVLRAYLVRCAERAAALQIELPTNAYLFSLAADGSSFLIPDSVTQRYDRMAERLGIKTTLHNLRHYSATELISAGVDLRTVAGRLGHSGGGATTLRRYAAWVAEADQRAATTLKGRMPATPLALIPEVKLAERSTAGDGIAMSSATNPPAGSSPAAEQNPCRRIASDLRAAIACGALEVGEPLPTLRTLAARYSVAESTAHRAVAMLAEEGLITVARGRRAVVLEAASGDIRTTTRSTRADKLR